MRRLLAGLWLGACALPAAATATAGWSIVDSPNSPPTATRNFLSATTCVSSSDCWAVGYYNISVSTTQTLIERWNGTTWSVVPSPNTGATQGNVLRSVACVSASDCWAVGSRDDNGSQQTLAQHWDGSAWTIVPSPSASGASYSYLLGVSCVASNDCTAVGYASGSTHQTLVERWDGNAWTVVASANTSTAQPNILYDVACLSAGDCWAVGYAVDAVTGFERTLIQRYDGTAWAIVAAPNALPSTNNQLQSVTCVAAAECWAVGSASNGNVLQTLVARWNGSAWAVVGSPNSAVTENNTFLDVACASTTECWAVGHSGDFARTFAARWNGTAWAAVASPSPGAQINALRGVACLPGGGGCRAVGHYDDAGMERALVERWDGAAWAVVAADNATTSQNNTLLGVTCASAIDCWAVASYYNGSVQQTLIERWDGASWNLVGSPNTSAAQYNILYDVKCPAASDCWAVGYFTSTSAWQPLMLRWNGAAWAIVSAPGTGATEDNFLTSLACVSASECWAVGYYNNGSAYQTLAEHWNGNAWSIVATPNHDAFNQHRFNGVSCASADDCWAVGHYFTGTAILTLAEHWNGASWEIVTTPNTAALENYLNSVNCISASDCWAVGRYLNGPTQQTLIEHWDGTSWSIVASPNVSPTAPNYLNRVSCTSTSDCWAVGAHFTDGHFQTLVQRWDGSAWRIVASPSTGAEQNNYLVGVSCAAPLDCWAVGQYVDDTGVYQTLVQRYLATPQAPDPFEFVQRTGVATNVYVTSEARTLSGFSAPLALTIQGNGQYRINGGAWTGAAGQLAPGDVLSIRHLSAGAGNALTETRVTVGDYSTDFRSVTSSVDRTPAAFGFTTQTGVAPGAVIESEPKIPSDYNTGIAVVPGPGAAYRINSGAWTTASGTLLPGETLQIRHTANTGSLGYAKTWLKVGGVVGYFTTRSK